MRYFLTLLLSLLPLTLFAQTQHSINIDAQSFAPVQIDAISGVAIDKIGKDHSQRECARIKMRINRMTAAEIGELSIRPRGGNVEVMKCVVANEGNGLIIELTAKEPTRFYLTHPKYGDSNEVEFNLEGGKEYKLNAELKISYPIFVSTNVIGAAVYIDGQFKGHTDDSYTLTAKNIQPGTHMLRLQHGNSSTEREIEVTGDKLIYRIEINTITSRPQYVVFEVTPKNAMVTIDNDSYAPDEFGIVQRTLNNGSYSYVVSANDYHEERGTFVVNGAKVVKSVKLNPAFGWVSIAGLGALSNANIYIDGNHVGKTPVTSYQLPSGTHRVKIVKELYLPFEENITIQDNILLQYEPKLVANFATTTLITDKDADIYVDNALVGRGTWTGNLASGVHIFEARKANHRTIVVDQTISPNPQKQNYNLGSPEPIMGTLDITSHPAMADVYIDDKLVGQTPMMTNVIIGTHRVSIRKEEYHNENMSVSIADGAVENLNVTLRGNNTTAKSVKVDPTPTKVTTVSSPKSSTNTKGVKDNQKYRTHQSGFESILGTTTTFTTKEQIMFGVDYIAGRRFNNHIYAGCGIGFNFDTDRYKRMIVNENETIQIPRSNLNMSLYGYFRWNIINRAVSPFVALGAGLNIAFNNKGYTSFGTFRYKAVSPLLNPQFGLNFRVSPKQSLWVAIGADTYSTPDYYGRSGLDAIIQDRLRSAITLHFGLTF